MSRVYLDLNDDGLYDRAKDHDLRFEGLKAHIRTITFLHVLLDRAIAVPEQWAVSSAACIQVLGELVEGFTTYVERGGNAKHPPVAFTTMHRSAQVVGQAPRGKELLAALWERSLSSSRLRLADAVDTEQGSGQGFAAADLSTRSALPDFLKRAVHEYDLGPDDRHRITDGLSTALNSRATAKALVSMSLYVRRFDTLEVRDGLEYTESLRDFFRTFRKRLDIEDPDAPYVADFKTTIDAVVDRFDHAHYVPMLREARRLKLPCTDELQHMLRCGVHASASRFCGANLTAYTCDLYETRDAAAAEPLAFASLDDLNSGEVEAAVWEVVSARAHGARQAIPKLSIGWPEVWEIVFQARHTPRFQRLRRELLRQARENASTLIGDDPLDPGVQELIETALQGVEEIAVSRHPNGIRLETPMKLQVAGAAGDAVQGVGGVAQAAGWAISAGGLATSTLPDFAGLGTVIATGGALLVAGVSALQIQQSRKQQRIRRRAPLII